MLKEEIPGILLNDITFQFTLNFINSVNLTYFILDQSTCYAVVKDTTKSYNISNV